MRTARKYLSLALLTLLLAAVTGESMAQETRLGRDGSVYHLQPMALGNALPGTSESVAADPVLALEIVRSDASREIALVPGTDGPEAELSWFLDYENVSDTIFVAWQQRSNIHSQILLASYADGTWSEPIAVSDHRFSLKSSPRIAITRESYRLPAEPAAGETEPTSSLIQQTTLHIVWYEERGSGPAVVYAPVLLLNGRYVGAHNRITLSELFPGEAAGASVSPTANLTPTVRTTTDQKGVVVGFVNPTNGLLTSLRVDTLSGEMGFISGDMRAHIIDVGARYRFEETTEVARFADDMRAHIIDVGAQMDRPLVRFVADEMRAHIIDVGARPNIASDEDVRRIADEMRAHIIDVGFRLDERGLSAAREVRSITAAFLSSDSMATGPDGVSTFARFQQMIESPLPEEGAGDETLIFSGSGEHALISWQEEDRLLYRETSGTGVWSETRVLQLDENLGLPSAQAILKDHLDAR